MLITDPDSIRDISSSLLDAEGKLKSVPARTLEQTTVQERALFGMRHAVYSFITDELVAFLKKRIGNRSAIEIGSGNGRLAHMLEIAATDNRQQESPEIKAYYALMRQPVIEYGDNVEKRPALNAVRHYKPDVVIACWVTHKYDPRNHAAEGNQDGVDEEALLAHCGQYVFIGNKHVHRNKPIWKLPHEIIEPPWLYSRAHNGSANFIAVWQGKKTCTTPYEPLSC